MPLVSKLDVPRLDGAPDSLLRLRWTPAHRVPAPYAREAALAMAGSFAVVHRVVEYWLEHLRREQDPLAAHTSLAVWAPLASLGGSCELAEALFDLAFSQVDPAAFARVASFAAAGTTEREAAVSALRGVIEDELEYFGVEAAVTGRAKSLYSIHKKLGNRDHLSIHDLYGLRLIVETVEQCYRALGVIHLCFAPYPGRFKDYIAKPKSNGYQSLHTVVRTSIHPHPVEFQIRTRAMHEEALHGRQAHFAYKHGHSHVPVVGKVRWVYPLTPHGEVRRLPKGATALDFAYSVHTELGRGYSGARVNGMMVPATTPLATGDIVEVIHSARVRPSQGQLARVQTARARNRIRALVERTH